MNKLKVLDLFSGIGGFSLGLERTGGFETVAFCEIEKFPQKVLAKHWPGVPIYDDVRTLTGDMIDADIITGGYPCQPFSNAGLRRGEEDDRHLWPEMYRLIREIRPRWVIAENVAGHINMGLDTVLSDLEKAGYTWWTFVIPACAVDAKHRRDRLWIVANSEGIGHGSRREPGNIPEKDGRQDGQVQGESRRASMQTGDVDDTNGAQLKRNGSAIGILTKYANPGSASWWATEPDVGQLVDGLPARLAGFRGLTNDQRWIQIPCSKAAEECLRDLRKHKNALRSSHGQELEKQRPIEFDDAVQFLSHIIASCSGRDNAEERETALQALRENILSSGNVQHAPNEVQTVWQSIDDTAADWFILATCLGRDWADSPIGRVASGIPDRAHRLKGLGNAVVPQIPELIGHAILDLINSQQVTTKALNRA